MAEQHSRSVSSRAKTVQVFGTVFFDLVFSGLSGPPEPGIEVRTGSLGLSPGGAANVAVALARLGVDVRMACAFADDTFGRYLWSTLEHEGIDLARSWRLPGWSTPVTVSMAYARERAMVTHEVAVPPLPAPDAIPCGDADACFVGLADAAAEWLASLHGRFGSVFADFGWDATEGSRPALLERLRHVDVFLPNAGEAVAYTGEQDILDAALRLAETVSLVVVKRGARGAVAAGAALADWHGGDLAMAGEVICEPALPFQALDTTGAGDVFDAGFIFGSIAGWPVERRLRFANLCAGQSLGFVGGSLAAPCWRDLAAWWEGQDDPGVRTAYAFLPALIEQHHAGRVCERPRASLLSGSALPATSGATPS